MWPGFKSHFDRIHFNTFGGGVYPKGGGGGFNRVMRMAHERRALASHQCGPGSNHISIEYISILLEGAYIQGGGGGDLIG